MKKIFLSLAFAMTLVSGNLFSQCNWFAGNTGSSADFNSVFFPSYYSRIIVGGNGAISKSNSGGDQWYQVTSGTTSNLNCVYFPTDSIGYIAGDNGALLKSINNGDFWTTLTSPIQSSIKGIFFINQNIGFLGGQSGMISKTINGGATWTNQNIGNSDINSIVFVNQNIGYAGGAAGALFKTIDAGVSWTSLTGVTTNSVNSICFTDSVTGFAVCQGGIIQKTNDGGTTWSSITSNTNYDLYSVAFHDFYYGYAVGAMGTVLKTDDAGQTWSIVPVGTTVLLKSIFIKYSEKFIVGASNTWLKYASEIILGQPNDQSVCTGGFSIDMAVSLAGNINSGIWQINKGTGWTDCINDTNHYNVTSPNMYIMNYTLSFNNYKYRFVFNSYCGNDTSDVATILVRAPLSGTIINLQSTYCAMDSVFQLQGTPAYGYFEGTGIVSSYGFNPSYVLDADTANIVYRYIDSTGCDGQINKTVLIYSLPVLQVDSLLKPGCNSPTGRVIVSAYNGHIPYQYLWSNGSTSNVLNNIASGKYNLTISDAMGCQRKDYVLVSDNSTLFAEIINPISTSCTNICDGSATVTAMNGILPYTYHWSNNQSDATATNLCNKQYFVTVSDSIGCRYFTETTIYYLQEAAKIHGYVSAMNQSILGILKIDLYDISSGSMVPVPNIHPVVQGTDFTIENIPAGLYYVKVIPDHHLNPHLSATFYKLNGSTRFWDEADSVSLQCGSNQYLNIYLVQMLDTGSGSGRISGFIHKPIGTGSKKTKGIYSTHDKLTGEPIPGAEIYVELEPDDEPIANTETNLSGFYEFTGIPNGNYSLTVQIPGVPMVDTIHVNVTPGNTNFTNNNYFVDVTGDAIKDTAHYYSVQNIDENISSVSIFPNPFKDAFFLNLDIPFGSDVRIDLFDVAGKERICIVSNYLEKGIHTFNLHPETVGLTSGFYFVKIKVNHSVYIKKLVKM